MSNEIKHEQLELTPDKDGFLFEVEDKGYIIFKLHMTISMLIIFLCLYAWNGFTLSNIVDGGRLGKLAVYISLPFFLYQLFSVIIYNIKKEKRKIKFYEKYILIEHISYKIMINDIEKIYIIESNSSTGKVMGQNVFLVLVFVPLFLFSFLCSILTLYIMSKKLK